MRKGFFNFVLLLCLAPTLCFAAAKALLDRDQINLSESVNVEISIDKSTSGNPDLSVLDADFDIGSTGKTVSVEMINGHLKQEARWVISLTPKRAGTLTIPAITVGSEKTQPVQLTVINKPVAHHALEDFFIETTLEPKEAYEQQAVVYTIQIWASKPLTNVQVTPPSVSDGVLLNPLDKQSNNIRKRNGREYEVVERKYLITADKAGTLMVHPPSLRGLSFDQNPTKQFFMGREPQSVHITSQDQKLLIKSKPATWHGSWWLPAINLSLKDEWSQDPHRWQVGTPVTRTIMIQGVGVAASQLPDLKIDAIVGMNTYPDKTESKNALSNNTLVGTRQIKIAYVPTQEGKFQLPAVKVSWWNVSSGKMEIAELPSMSLMISPEASKTPSAGEPIVKTDEKRQSLSNPEMISTEKNADYTIWQWFTILLLVLLFISLIYIIILWRKLKYPMVSSNQKVSNREVDFTSVREAINEIKKSCVKNNPRATMNATIVWARLQWPTSAITSLQDVANQLNHSEFFIQTSKLLASCYRHEKAQWNADEYWHTFKQCADLNKNFNNQQQTPLPPLNIQ